LEIESNIPIVSDEAYINEIQFPKLMELGLAGVFSGMNLKNLLEPFKNCLLEKRQVLNLRNSKYTSSEKLFEFLRQLNSISCLDTLEITLKLGLIVTAKTISAFLKEAQEFTEFSREMKNVSLFVSASFDLANYKGKLDAFSRLFKKLDLE